ncbi:MAG: carbon starvation protein CstA [Bacteroidetes bacterium GWA2_32_17]|nr:MAG: carbon starvation protein CstA [Bacteroidetes bacterium GWA2_32_17]
MFTFLLSILALLLGYFFYGKLVEKIFGIDVNRKTPAETMTDGVDFVPLGWGRIFLIQFLNIAGLGPIFGAIAGAMWGPVAFLWIVFGCIFGGAVHDFFSGMISLRMGGQSVPEIVGKYMGVGVKQFMRVFTIGMMILVGAVFIMGPAKIIAGLTPDYLDVTFWAIVIFAYYILATLLPIDKLIGRVYPFFGFAILFMALGITIPMLYNGLPIPELVPANIINMNANSDAFPVFPMLFVTIACGAISGFHSTQSPLMARCLKNEKYGRRVFYGAMIAEGIVALIWAAVAMSFFGGVKELNVVMAVEKGNAAWIVNEICNSLLGKFGAVLAILGVVAAPITSGDTAFRSARLILADFLKIPQKKIKNRLMLTVPLFFVGFILTQVDFSIIWRYMAWSNQTLATIVLWTITVYLAVNKKFYWLTLLPSVFMTAVVTAYLLVAPEGFKMNVQNGQIIGICLSIVTAIVFMIWNYRKPKTINN